MNGWGCREGSRKRLAMVPQSVDNLKFNQLLHLLRSCPVWRHFELCQTHRPLLTKDLCWIPNSITKELHNMKQVILILRFFNHKGEIIILTSQICHENYQELTMEYLVPGEFSKCSDKWLHRSLFSNEVETCLIIYKGIKCLKVSDYCHKGNSIIYSHSDFL